MRAERWEHGSDLTWPAFEPDREPQSPVPARARWYGSGRDALRALVGHGRSLGWRRVWLPSYFCQEVVAAVAGEATETCLYADRPGASPELPAGLGAGDALLTVNYFGLRATSPLTRLRERSVVVIEDHTHDPWSAWSARSEADFAVVALRKTLPVPDGGLLWSPVGHELPPELPVTAERRLAAFDKLAATVLKDLYLDGHAIQKAQFRELAVRGETRIASGVPSGGTEFTRALVHAFPVRAWRERRAINWRAFVEAWPERADVRVWPPEAGAAPFGVILEVASFELRERLRAGLVERNIFPAVLWPLEEPALGPVDAAAAHLARRVLMLHCDARYSIEDLRRVALTLAEICARETA